MKSKRTSYIIAIAICVALILSMSCEMFTTSQLTMFKRDLSELQKDLTTDTLLGSLSDSRVRSDPEACKATLKALGERDLSNVSPDNANDILSAATSTIIPVSTLTSLTDTLLEEANTTSGEASTPNVSNIVASAIKQIPKVDTVAVNKILSNEDLLKDENTNLETVAMASAAVVVGSFANAGFDTPEKFDTVFKELTKGVSGVMDTADENDENVAENVAAKIEEVLNKNGASEVSESVKTAINALIVIQDNPAYQTTKVVGTPLKDILGDFLGSNSVNVE